MIKRNHFWQLFLALLLVAFSVVCSFADDGEGQGGGQNRDEPLTLVSSNIRDGQEGVAVDAEIMLEFSKNVVNMAVAENNKSCIFLTDREGADVPIEIRMGDEQVDPTIKRLVGIVPKEPFEPDSVYTLTISIGFQSKSGTSLGTPIIISFQTAGSSADSGSVNGEKEGIGIEPATQGVTTDPCLSKDTLGSTDGISEGTALNQTPTGRKMSPWMIFSAVCFTAATVMLLIYAIRRIKK